MFAKWMLEFWYKARGYAIVAMILMALCCLIFCSNHPVDVHLPDPNDPHVRREMDGGASDRREAAERAREKQDSGQELSDQDKRDLAEFLMRDCA